MANRLQIRHGNGTPKVENLTANPPVIGLLPFELGWNGTDLYINNNQASGQDCIMIATTNALPLARGGTGGTTGLDAANNLSIAYWGKLIGTQLENNTNLNNYNWTNDKIGSYYSGSASTSASLNGTPFTQSGFKFFVLGGYNINHTLQVAFPASATPYMRIEKGTAGTWEDWIKLAYVPSEAVGDTTTPVYANAGGKLIACSSRLTDYIPITAKGAANGIATLNANSKITAEQASIQIQSNKTASFTLASTDAGTLIPVNSTSAVTITIPANDSVNFPVGTEIEFLRYNTGSVTFVAASGVTLRSANNLTSISDRYAFARLKKYSTNVWILAGSLQ